MPPRNRADYFDIHDEAEQPLAGLLVLMDGRGQPARAELHVAADIERPAAREAIQHAQNLLSSRYTAPAQPAANPSDIDDESPSGARLPLYVLQVNQQNVVEVELPITPVSPPPLSGSALTRRAAAGTALRRTDDPVEREFNLPSAGSLLPYVLAGVVGLVLVLAVWAADVVIERSRADGPAPGVAVVDGEAGGETASAAGDEAAQPGASDIVSSAITGTTGITDAAAGGTAAGTTAGDAAQGEAQTNGLPPSRLADASLEVGDRAQMGPGLQAFLVPELSDELIQNPVENNLGVLTDEQVVTLVGGPVWRPGADDTVVWWQVELASGDVFWVPANSSQFTLLRPVE